MPYHPLARRYAFWDNTVYIIHQLIKDIDGQTACKWPDEKDEEIMNSLLSLLNAVDIVASTRYHEVLGDQIEELKARVLEKHHVEEILIDGQREEGD